MTWAVSHCDAAFGLEDVAVLLEPAKDLAKPYELAIGVELLARELVQLVAVGLALRDQLDNALLDPLRPQFQVERVRVSLGQHVLDLVSDLHTTAVCAV